MSDTGFKNFIKTAKRESRSLSSKLPYFFYIKYYIKWRKYLRGNKNPLEDEIPWMNFAAIDFLQKIAKPSFKVFEYGSGGSSLFWSSRVKEVISIEHDKEWANNVINTLRKKNKNNVQVFFIPAQKDEMFASKSIENPLDYLSTDEKSAFQNYENYVKKINDYSEGTFDIVVIDGRARTSCILTARSKIKSGGYMVVDNTEREYYLQNTLPVLQKEGWKQYDFIGPVPYLTHFCKTTIFQKP